MAIVATLGAIVAVVIAYRPFGTRGVVDRAIGMTAVLVAVAVAAAATVAATSTDLTLTRALRAQSPHDLLWVDHAAHGEVTAVATPVSLQKDLLGPLYWNASIQREVVLDSGNPSDAFAAPPLQVAKDGTLLNAEGDILFNDFGTTTALAHAKRIARAGQFSLWRSRRRPRFRVLVEGRFFDGWLDKAGRIRVWPLRNGRFATELSFRVSLPRRWPSEIPLRLGRNAFLISPGRPVDIVCRSTAGPVDVHFSSKRYRLAPDFRQLTVRLTRIRTLDLQARINATERSTACSRSR